MKKRLTVKQLHVRDEKIRRMYGTEKYSQRELAKVVGLSKSQVGRIVY